MSSANFDIRPFIHAHSNTTLGKSVDDPQIKRLRDMQERLKHLQSTPGAKQISKRGSVDKMGWLRQRLDALKMMLLHASPAQAKALAQELKNIARELASAAKSLGAGSRGQAASPETETPNVSAESTTASTQAEATVAEPNLAQTIAGTDETNQQGADEKPTPPKVDDAVMRGLLLDLKKLLKEVVNMLKSKLAGAGKDAHEDMRAIEKSTSELDGALQQGATSDLFTDQGNLALGSGSFTVSGLNINLTA